jgi:hypothetical protein
MASVRAADRRAQRLERARRTLTAKLPGAEGCVEKVMART